MSTASSSLRSRLGNALLLLLLVALALWLLHLHAAPWPALTPQTAPRGWAAFAAALWVLLCLLLQRGTARTQTSQEDAQWLLIHASQTGTALELAQRSAESLRAAGQRVALCDLATLDAAQLRGRHCLLVASTTGEGDPPDTALGFAAQAMNQPADLHGTQYAVLALGDRSYSGYCAFGHRLDGWLRASGAQPLFDLIEVDNADPGALRHWQHQLGVLGGSVDAGDWSRPQYQSWTLAARRLLNPGSQGGPALHLALQPPTAEAAHWQAGDIAEIGPRQSAAAVSGWLSGRAFSGAEPVHLQGEKMTLAEALARSFLPTAGAADQDPQALADALQPLPHREYSIASVPGDGTLELLVRLMQREDGSPGIGSGWLCSHADLGSPIALRIRANPGFHGPDPGRPLILIGNGTGLAGLRAQLKERIAAGAHRNWLLFGERSAAHDAFFGDELDAWLRAGQLARLDLVYSRDGGTHRYVQDALRAETPRLRQWLDDGAALYVCGSLQGMAPGVDAVLLELLGEAGVAELLQAGRYRRDVY